MAGKSEKEAWKMAEFQAGVRDHAPVGYGGLGDRPTGTTRRARRMQEAWDKDMDSRINQQRAVQYMDIQERAEQRMQRGQDMELKSKAFAEDRESRVMEEASQITDEVLGVVSPDGQVITPPIRPDDPDAIERLEGVGGRFKFGMENQTAASIWTALYNDATKFREDEVNKSKLREGVAAEVSAKSGKPFGELGAYDERGIFFPNLSAIADAQEEISKRQASEVEERTIRTETRRAEAQANVVEDRDAKLREREIQKEIRKASDELKRVKARIDAKGKETKRDREDILAAKTILLDRQIDKADIRGFVFDDQQALKKAMDEGKIPSGTRAFIGRTPVDIP